MFLALDLRDSRFHQFLNKRSWERLVRGEVDGPFGCGEALKFVIGSINEAPVLGREWSRLRLDDDMPC